MQETDEAVRYYLGQLRSGTDSTAFFGLLDLGSEAMPILIAAASDPRNRDIRAELVEVIWQYRRPQAIGFLGSALDDADPEVWKQALDGLVALGGPTAGQQVREALERRMTRGAAKGATEDWLREALEQIGQADADSAEPQR